MLCAITAAAQSEKGFPVCQDRGLTRSEAGAVHRSQRCRRKRPANSYDNLYTEKRNKINYYRMRDEEKRKWDIKNYAFQNAPFFW